MSTDNTAIGFVIDPAGNSTAVGNIGGVYAYPTGFLVKGHDPNTLHTWVECPSKVAEAWRNELNDAMSRHRAGRPFPKIDWRAIAEAVDPAFTAHFFDGAPLPAVGPKRREMKVVPTTA
jgi:hypothetical protein